MSGNPIAMVCLSLQSQLNIGIRQGQDNRLQRRFQQIEKLPAKDKRQITQLIDTFIKAAQVQQST